MSGKRFVRGANELRRTSQQRKVSGETFLIVTEGKKTEPNYFKALRERLSLKATDIKIVHPDATDPKRLTLEAIRLRSERESEARHSSIVVPYDEVWVVFDLEKASDPRRRQADEAKKLAGADQIHFADSNPCFEFWLLLHVEHTTKPFADCRSVMVQLKRHWVNYAKGQSPPNEFLEKLPAAVANAQRVRKHHEDCGGDGNPSTQVDVLVRLMDEASHPDWRLL